MADAEQLPEGTDTIIDGAGVNDEDELDGGSEPVASAATGEQDNDRAASSQTNAGADPSASQGTAQAAPGASDGGATSFMDRIGDLRGQAGDRARDFAQAGKDRATSALDSLIQTVEDAAAEIDDKLGSQYGDYARRAAQGIGNFSDTFRDKDVDELFTDARELVKKSPAIAVGTAAALGFVVARLARAGVAEASPDKDAPRT